MMMIVGAIFDFPIWIIPRFESRTEWGFLRDSQSVSVSVFFCFCLLQGRILKSFRMTKRRRRRRRIHPPLPPPRWGRSSIQLRIMVTHRLVWCMNALYTWEGEMGWAVSIFVLFSSFFLHFSRFVSLMGEQCIQHLAGRCLPFCFLPLSLLLLSSYYHHHHHIIIIMIIIYIYEYICWGVILLLLLS